MNQSIILGIDVGGSGIKGAPVDIKEGTLTEPRFRIETPQPATPKAVVDTINAVVEHFNWKGPVGIGLPSVIQQGIVRTASNIDKNWIGKNANELISKRTGCPAKVLNDADVAALAEMKFGVGKEAKGVSLMLTIGTGIGSAFFSNGKLIPNTELGHLHLKGHEKVAEKYCANSIREKEDLSWEEWGSRFNEYLNHVYGLFYPDLIIIGGGQSKKMHHFEHLLTAPVKVVPAILKNEAGIVGAALAAKEMKEKVL